MNLHFWLAVITWFTAAVMLIVIPITYKQQTRYGESAPRLFAKVVSHEQGIARGGLEGGHHIAVVVEWSSSSTHPAGRKVIYDFDPLPAVGETVELAMPNGNIDELGPVISQETRIKSAFSFLAICALVVGLGFLLYAGSKAGASPLLKYSPLVALSLGLAWLGFLLESTGRGDREAELSAMEVTTGRVIHVEQCGTRSSGRSSAPVYCVDVEYVAFGKTHVSHRDNWWTAPRVGQELTVRFHDYRPDFAVVDEENLSRTSSWIGYGIIALGILLALFFLKRWFSIGA